MGYCYEPIGPGGVPLGVRLKADYLSRRSGDVTAEVVVESTLPGVAPHLHQGRLNLDSTRSKQELAKELTTITNGAVQWRGLIEDLCVAVLAAERQGEPFSPVGPARVVRSNHFLVERILPQGRASILYGPWANGKGWLAVGIAVSVAAGLSFAGLGVEQGPVLYLDWEDDQDTFDERIWMICRGLGLTEPPAGIFYRSCRGSLTGQVHQIARFVDEHGVKLSVTDSVGLAAGTSGERGSYEDNALGLFEGLRRIRGAHLLIDHVSEEGRQNSKTVGKAYGSIYKMAMVRNAWEIRKDQDLGASAFRVGLYHTKANHGPLLPPLGFRLDFSMEHAVCIDADDVEGSSELAARLPIPLRLAGLLGEAGEPLFAREIAERLGITDNHARNELSRHPDKFGKTTDNRWMLRTRSQVVRPDGVQMVRLENGDVVPL